MANRDGERECDRLEKLERETERLTGLVERSRSEVRALQWLLAGVTVIGMGALFYLHEAGVLKFGKLSKEPEKIVESQEFGLYNRKGDRVMLVDYDKFGYPNLVFMDLLKNYKMGIKVWPEGGGAPGMVFYDESGVRGNWRMDDNNSTVLNLMGKGKKGSISLAVTAEGDPRLKIVDKAGKVLFEVPSNAGQPPQVTDHARAERKPEHLRLPVK